MRLVTLLSLSAVWAAPALAADAPAPAAGQPPVCTTVTTVVKRGDVVLSTNSTTRCEDAAHPGGGFNAGSLLAAPGAVLSAPASVLGSLGSGNGDQLTARNTAGDWRAVDRKSGDVCHMMLSVQTTSAGYVARPSACRGALAKAHAWTYRDGAAELLAADGGAIVRLTGTRDLLTGATDDGDVLTLQR